MSRSYQHSAVSRLTFLWVSALELILPPSRLLRRALPHGRARHLPVRAVGRAHFSVSRDTGPLRQSSRGSSLKLRGQGRPGVIMIISLGG